MCVAVGQIVLECVLQCVLQYVLQSMGWHHVVGSLQSYALAIWGASLFVKETYRSRALSHSRLPELLMRIRLPA